MTAHHVFHNLVLKYGKKNVAPNAKKIGDFINLQIAAIQEECARSNNEYEKSYQKRLLKRWNQLPHQPADKTELNDMASLDAIRFNLPIRQTKKLISSCTDPERKKMLIKKLKKLKEDQKKYARNPIRTSPNPARG